ncbi:N-acetylmuramoyl-L-alanine amidase [Neolewinella lacunae]|uniref:N-acetylmuramoyl-L-alanine amidase n=2 Tax=Neolewinella lacunae TaxID=1517758 RepID=A0A923PPN3_9BACT|nr:N-acetylmuramoyl-L-alanine amidase [Neolewinella lacunae]MBC6995179.1 N-acetylmuramoyl-L-alanine amidase [Neolewinella lacunae]MDN3634129.1 N-acetylmuramoyl-L-alanine amidase [Neolewinella lacunae]
MTTNSLLASLGEARFNVSLMEGARKSTPLPANGVQKVVIDAGHGGKDPGGMGGKSQEKHIALNIAHLLAMGIRMNFPDVEVIMTRKDDTFIPLHERAAIANRAGADLFISIHANIMPGSSATAGTETFVMGQHVAKHNLDVAKRENAAILLEDNVEANYGYDPNSDEGHIMMSMFQHAFLERSIQFADLVEREFASAGRKSRGVKQAGFVVLKETTMPSVLVETGFMSNPAEESFLLSDAGQQKLANALLKAFAAYYKSMGGKHEVVMDKVNPAPSPAPAVQQAVATPVNFQWNAPSTAPPPPPTTAPATKAPLNSVFGRELSLSDLPAAGQRQWTAKGVSATPIQYTPEPQMYNYQPPVPTVSTAAPAASAPVPATYRTVVSKQVSNSPTAPPDRVIPGQRPAPATYGTPVRTPRDTAPDKNAYQFRQAKDVVVAPATPTVDLSKIPDQQLRYTIQLLATQRAVSLDEPQWKKVPYPLKIVAEDGYKKIQVQGLTTAAEAAAAKERLKTAGFFDAMVVVYLDGKRLAPKHVAYLLSR